VDPDPGSQKTRGSGGSGFGYGTLEVRVADPAYHFYADPNPNPAHHLNSDPDPAFHYNADNFVPPGLHCERLQPSTALFLAFKASESGLLCGSGSSLLSHPALCIMTPFLHRYSAHMNSKLNCFLKKLMIKGTAEHLVFCLEYEASQLRHSPIADQPENMYIF
jgi:hypothetical protein